jgi:Glycosyl transferase family group 2
MSRGLMSKSAKISIIIPVKPGGEVTALGRLKDLDYPSDLLEIFVAQGRCPSRQRNTAAGTASGEILYFLDDDSRVAPGFLHRAARHFDDPAVAVVGGPSLTPDTDSLLQHAFGMTFSSIMGGGGMRNRYRQTGISRSTSDRELILCNLALRREQFLLMEGFDERLYPNEENELMDRIRRDGGLLIHDPELAVHRSQRPTIGAFCRQLHGYGRGRGEQTLISGVIKPITFVPLLFLLYLLLVPVIRSPLYPLPLVCYLLLLVLVTVIQAAASGRPLAALFLPVVMPLFHICYGSGMIRWMLRPRRARRDADSCGVSVRRVKEFGGPILPESDCGSGLNLEQAI